MGCPEDPRDAHMPAQQHCVFCGAYCQHTRDHVPPKGLFAPPRPNNLITVPACDRCNGSANLDDEFMQRMAITAGTERNEDACKVSRSLLRALEKPEKQGMRFGLARSIKPVNIVTPSGLYIGPGLKMTMDGERLGRILRKITVGMLWEMTRRHLKAERKKNFSEADLPRLPPNYRAFAHQVGHGPDHPELRRSERNIMYLRPEVIGNGTFVYRYGIDESNAFISIWRFEFYGAYAFMGYTALDHGTESTLMGLKDPTPEMLKEAAEAPYG